MPKKEHNNVKMLRKIREELSLELEKMSPKQREEYFKGASEIYGGLKKMAKARAAITR